MLPLRSAVIGTLALQVLPDDVDELLMQAFAQGNARAFEWLYERHRGWLLRMLQSKCRAGDFSLDLADDIAQETWLVIVRTSGQYQATAKFTTWLFRLAQQRLIDHLRRLNSAPERVVVATPSDDLDGLPQTDQVAADLSFDPAVMLDRRQLYVALTEALDALPQDQREVFILTTEAGMTVPEAAQALVWPLEATKSRLRYARAKLAVALESFRP